MSIPFVGLRKAAGHVERYHSVERVGVSAKSPAKPSRTSKISHPCHCAATELLADKRLLCALGIDEKVLFVLFGKEGEMDILC
jgi:hypothetical protein